MQIIQQSFEFMDKVDGDTILTKLEESGRVCYKSEDYIKEGSKERFLKSIIKMGHESVLEHVNLTIQVITSRSISHQLVRHRIASYSQESQRYCNYSKDKFGDEITVIKPSTLPEYSKEYLVWLQACKISERAYFELLELGVKPEDAREVLPNSTKTEIVVTMNIRSWRNFFKQRTHISADPKMRELANLILNGFKVKIPILFDDLNV